MIKRVNIILIVLSTSFLISCSDINFLTNPILNIETPNYYRESYAWENGSKFGIFIATPSEQ